MQRSKLFGLKVAEQSLESVQSYVDNELSQKRPDLFLVRFLYERLLKEKCFEATVWLRYTDYLVRSPYCRVSLS